MSSIESIATPTFPTSPRARIIGIHPDLRRQIECHRQAGRAALEQVSITSIRFRGRRKPRVLAHGPQLASVHRWLWTARERERAGCAEVALRIEAALAERALIEIDGQLRHDERKRISNFQTV
jgi:hypothetical protein